MAATYRGERLHDVCSLLVVSSDHCRLLSYHGSLNTTPGLVLVRLITLRTPTSMAAPAFNHEPVTQSPQSIVRRSQAGFRINTDPMCIVARPRDACVAHSDRSCLKLVAEGRRE
jgi:hypothetical protein